MGLRDRIRTFAEPRRDETRPIGRSGTINTEGFLAETEKNRNLVWPNNLDVYEQMRTSEAVIRWMLALVSTPIRAAAWSIEPAGSEDEDKEVAAFIEHCLFDELDGGWDEFLRQALTYLDFGHAVFERVAEFRPIEFSYELDARQPDQTLDPNNLSQTVTRDAFVISRLAPRLQRTIQKWIPDPGDSSKLKEIEQWLFDPGPDNYPRIPAERLVIFVNEKEGDNWRGRSLLRSAYKPYQRKLKLENLEAIAYERSAGLPVIYPPSDATDPQLDAVEAGLQDLRQAEQVYFMMPGPKAGTVKEREGWTFDAVSIQGDGSKSATDAITRYGNEMAMNVLAEFMKLGHEKVGARSTADIQQDPYYQAVESYARYIEDVVSEQVVKPLCDWNYDTNRYPRLKASKITAKNVQWLGQVISQLVSAGALTIDPDTENAVRDILDLPPRRPDAEEVGATSNGHGPADQVPPPSDGKPAEVGPPANPNRTYAEFVPRRELAPAEQSVAFAEIKQRLDNAQADFAELAQRAAQGALQRAEQQAQQAVESHSPEAVPLVWVQPDEIKTAIQGELSALYDEGQRQVRSELRRQNKGVTFAEPDQTQQAIFTALAATAAASIAQAAQRALQARALREIETGTAPSGPGYDPEAALREASRQASLGSVSSAFNAGREAEITQQAAVIDHTIYSAVLDENCCEECASADGTTSPPGEPDPGVPNPNCYGGGACRCMDIPVANALVAA